MRRFFLAIVATTVIGSSLFLTPAQRRPEKPRRTIAASLLSDRGTDVITAAQLKDYLSFIASDEMEGRDTPSRGLDTAAKFLATNLSRWNLKPAGDDGTYFQKIALKRDIIDRAQTQVALNGQPLTLGEDYIPSPRSGNATGNMVFGGNGWYVKAKNIDAYKDIDPTGKVVVIFASPDGLPRGITREDLGGKRGEDWMDAAEYARKRGALGLVIVPDFQFLAAWDRNRQRATERGTTVVEKFQPASPAQLPAIIASPRIASLILQGERQSAASIFDAAASGKLPASFEINAAKKISIAVVTKSDALATQNVVAIFEGADPVLKNEYVALGAHYDHVGMGTAVNGDAIYNGADDDGSGTTTLLAIAEALSKARVRPRRSVLFVWHAGEEKGLWGSRYFTEYPTVPLDKIVTQINIDMIGRSKFEGDTNPRNRELSGPHEIYVIGSKMMSSELGEITEAVNKGYLNLTFDYRYDDPNDPNRFFFRSDHYNYARKGIPIVFFFDGEHEDYHRPGDSPDKIDYQKMEKVGRTVYLLLWELTERPARPVVDKQLPAQLMGGN